MTIKNQVNEDLKNAMRAREKNKLDALRLIMAAVKQIEVDERIEIDDARMLVILDKLAKQRNESISQFKAAERHDLVEQEEYELGLINHYLPEPLTEAEITTLVDEAFAAVNAQVMSDMGKVMAHLKSSMQGRADMSKVSAMIKAKLS
ncbi:MAG: GatB/YqeY domain-containing protein [Legionellaceae bacterium]|nr:GatB/YqeY domain-containing protein [Legionellaceae bacterium]